MTDTNKLDRPRPIMPDLEGDNLVIQAVMIAATKLAQLEKNRTLDERSRRECMAVRDLLERAENHLMPTLAQSRKAMEATP